MRREPLPHALDIALHPWIRHRVGVRVDFRKIEMPGLRVARVAAAPAFLGERAIVSPALFRVAQNLIGLVHQFLPLDVAGGAAIGVILFRKRLPRRLNYLERREFAYLQHFISVGHRFAAIEMKRNPASTSPPTSITVFFETPGALEVEGAPHPAQYAPPAGSGPAKLHG